MAFIAEDRVRDVWTGTGTGAITVSGTAPTGYRTFDDVVATSDTFAYCIAHQTLNEWEVGIGTKTGADAFSRTTIISTSLGEPGSAINFSAGTKDVILVYPPVTTTAQYWDNTVGKVLTTDQINAAGALQTLSQSAGTIAFDMSLGFNAQITMAGDWTLGDPSGEIVGRTGMIVFTQDGTGTQTLAYHANWEAAGGSLPVLSTAPGAKDIIFYIVQSSTSFVITGSLLAVA